MFFCSLPLMATFLVALGSVPALAQDTFITKENAPPPFGTKAQEEVLIANICGTQIKDLGQAGCACLAKEAMTALDDPQREYLILSVVQPPAADRTATARSQADLKTIALFLTSAQTECAAPAQPSEVPRLAPEAPTPSQSAPAQ